MFLEAAKIGGLDIQLVYYRGTDEVKASEWFADAHELVRRMGTIGCEAGSTKIARVLQHIRAEHQRQKVGAVIFIGDAVEEPPPQLYDAAAGLGCRSFLFRRATAWPLLSINTAKSSSPTLCKPSKASFARSPGLRAAPTPSSMPGLPPSSPNCCARSPRSQPAA